MKITATYSLNGSIAETFPIDEEGSFWIMFRKPSLVLHLDKEDKSLQIDDTDFESSLFYASNFISTRSASDGQFDQILFWKFLGSISSRFEEEINDCCKMVVEELLSGG